MVLIADEYNTLSVFANEFNYVFINAVQLNLTHSVQQGCVFGKPA